jgi:CheY-like chemotaxis protein
VSLLNRVVLVVDDDPDICWALDHLLAGLGAQCIRALDGQSALQSAQLNRPALVLVDAKLPDMGGLDLAREIRCANLGVAVLVVSGYFYKDDAVIQTALEQGLIRGFVEKPFSHTEILEAMETALCSPEVASGTAEPLTAC